MITLTGPAKERADPAMEAMGGGARRGSGGGGEHEARESDRGGRLLGRRRSRADFGAAGLTGARGGFILRAARGGEARAGGHRKYRRAAGSRQAGGGQFFLKDFFLSLSSGYRIHAYMEL